MDFLKKLDIKFVSAIKIILLALATIVVLAIGFHLVESSVNAIKGSSSYQKLSPSSSVSSSYYGIFEDSLDSGSISLSPRNISATGTEAEEFEVTEYSARIETNQLEKVNETIENLKPLEYVIFESSNKNDNSSNYVFKVKNENIDEVLNIIKDLNPKQLSENIYTIKGSIDDFTSEIEILKNKLLTIDETMEKAIDAYDGITALAINVKDVESLAKIIDSKIDIIERLTQERININSQLERLERSKAEQMDRIEYTYFNVNIIENKFVDGSNIKDSWKAAIREFVTDINKIAQDITINLLSFIFFILQYIIYLFILIIVAKYSWKTAQKIWKK
jgi:hypothetical protein